MHDNQWSGWSTVGSTTSTGDGKRSAYDMQPITAIRFEDTSGRYAEYTLDPMFQGQTLVSIVRSCMGGDASNDGSAIWTDGHCSSVGTLQSSLGVSAASSLRIGVGDGSAVADPHDWTVFMPLAGNGDGDFAGNDTWCFGGANQTNNGFSGRVFMYGTGLY